MNRLALHLSVTIIYEYQEHGIIRLWIILFQIKTFRSASCVASFLLAHLPTFHRACFSQGFLGKQKQPAALRSVIQTELPAVPQHRSAVTARLVRDPANYTAPVRFWRSTAPSGALGGIPSDIKGVLPNPKKQMVLKDGTSGG